ncbi:uncharacterized protein LOC131939122 [Physella acuta]|uniref:uncharacterized protein LOC131939122 n=1 Tax=Physella acuta TaxID=109671 RepID=UPI0027DC68C2|nr:uncharacterized protein LOC131939122 [Physella acuta]XP_059153329.1 uncharacterized protein LOC131939122 [Physella acuta]
MWFDTVRPFAPGVKKFALCLTCLLMIGVALVFNTTIAFAVVVSLSAILIKIYKIDPEPILLLLMHVIITASMLYDPTTTFAFIVVVVAAVVTFADCDLPAERVVVFVISVTVPAIFGKVTAIVACVLITLAISVFKLRPLQPQTVSLLGLGSLALTLVFNKVVGSVLVFFFMAVVTGLFVVNKVKKNHELNERSASPPPRNISTHPNGYLPLSSPLDSLDLHGHTVTGAMKVLHSFLQEHEEAYRRNRAQHIRHVTIITGDGQDSNLIKPTVVNFLKINKYKFETPPDTTGLVKVDLDSHSF